MTHADLKDLDVGSDAPVLLLAFPGAAASWIGFDAPARLLAGSLSARISLISTALASVAASALFMLNRVNAGDIFFERRIIDGYAVLGIHNYCWAVLALAALGNAIFITYRWFVRSIAYGRLASRRPLE